jgi:hypothetical protein
MAKAITTGTWNYRIMVDEYKGEKYFEIHEVHYSKDKKPQAYTTEPVSVHSDTKKGIKWVLEKMLEACDKPILWKGSRWPQEYNGRIPKAVTHEVVKQAMKATVHDVIVPKVVRDGIVKRGKIHENH